MINEIEAGQLCDTTFSAIHHGIGQLSAVPGLIKKIIKERAWLRRKVKMHGIVELGSLTELVTKPPLVGWGEDPSKIEALLKDDPEALRMFREATTAPAHVHRKKNDGHNITIRRGTAKGYSLDRLSREAPALYERVKSGELSANAAAIEAGFRRRTITIPLDVDLAAASLRRHFPESDLARLKGLL